MKQEIQIADKLTLDGVARDTKGILDILDIGRDGEGLHTILNKIKHSVWLSDYKEHGLNSYVNNNKDIFYELFSDLEIVMNDVDEIFEALKVANSLNISGKAFMAVYDFDYKGEEELESVKSWSGFKGSDEEFAKAALNSSLLFDMFFYNAPSLVEFLHRDLFVKTVSQTTILLQRLYSLYTKNFNDKVLKNNYVYFLGSYIGSPAFKNYVATTDNPLYKVEKKTLRFSSGVSTIPLFMTNRCLVVGLKCDGVNLNMISDVTLTSNAYANSTIGEAYSTGKTAISTLLYLRLFLSMVYIKLEGIGYSDVSFDFELHYLSF